MRIVLVSIFGFLSIAGLLMWRPSLLVGTGFIPNFGARPLPTDQLAELEPANFLVPSPALPEPRLARDLYNQNIAAVITSTPPPTTNSLANMSTMRANSANFHPGNPLAGLVDGCTDGSALCSPGTGNSSMMWVEFDLGQSYALTSVRLFGDANNSWVSRTWNFLYRENAADSWKTAFIKENAFINGWSTKSLSAVARYVRVEVTGSVDLLSVQAREFQVFGTPASPSPTTTNMSFNDTYSIDGQLEETGSITESRSSFWWVNSGGREINNLGTGKTIQSELSALDKWRLAYALANPVDTDNGYHPQNIFRLVQRGSWTNFTETAYFKIKKMNLSASPNRNASNGLLLFSRYSAGDNLYYSGVRVDGMAVIKKKKSGTYYTMASSKIITNGTYERTLNPNLLPVNVWIGLRSVVTTDSATGAVNIKLYTDVNKTGVWTKVLESVDNNQSYGGAAIPGGGYAGIRTDFMDVEIDDYTITSQ